MHLVPFWEGQLNNLQFVHVDISVCFLPCVPIFLALSNLFDIISMRKFRNWIPLDYSQNLLIKLEDIELD